MMNNEPLSANQASHYELLKEKGEEALIEDDYKQALTFFEQALKEAPHYPEAYNNIGRVYSAMEELEKAREYYKQAIDLDASYSKAYSNLANISSANKDYTSAIDYAERALRLNPDDAIVYNNLGNYYKKLGQLDHSERCYKKSMELDSAFVFPQYNYGLLLKEQKKWPESIALLKKVALDPPKGAKIHVFRHLAEIYVHIRDENNSDEVSRNLIYYFGKLLEANSQNHLKENLSSEYYYYANSQIAYSYLELNDYIKAIEKYKYCLELDPSKDLGFTYYYLAYSNYALKQLDIAIEYCEKMLDEKFDTRTSYELMGDIYKTKGDLKTAEMCWEKSKEI